MLIILLIFSIKIFLSEYALQNSVQFILFITKISNFVFYIPQVRASLETLRKDKLIRSITKGEKEEVGPGGGALKFNHYFIRLVACFIMSCVS